MTPARTVRFGYDAQNDLRQVTDVGGGITSFTYDANHRMLTMRFPRFYASTQTPAPEITNHYDASGRVDWQSNQLGPTTGKTLFDHAPAGEPPNTTKVTDPKGNVAVYRFEYGLLWSETHGYGTPLAATRLHEYDPASIGCTKTTDPSGRETLKGYDPPTGNLTSATNALGQTTTWVYNSRNQLTSTTDVGGTTTTFTYDGAWGSGAGHLTRVSTPLKDGAGNVVDTRFTTYRYEEALKPGDLTSMSDPNHPYVSSSSKQWKYHYDAYGMRDQVISPMGDKTTWAYNNAGWPTEMVTPKGYVAPNTPAQYRTTYEEHDAFGRIKKARNPLAQLIVDRTYDANGNLATSRDAKGNLTSYLYDPADQLLTIDRPAPASDPVNQYWPDGSLKVQRDGAGRETTYAYDPLGRPTTVTDPLLRTTTNAYDPAGNLLTKQTPGGSCTSTPKSGCTTLTYDAADRLKTVTYSDGATPNITDTTYDANGRKRTQALSNGTVASWDYDSLGRLTKSDDGTGAVRYSYDIAGTRTKLAYPGGSCVTPVSRCVTYGVNDDLQVTSMTDWNNQLTQFGYDENGNLKSTTFPSATTNVDDYGFDAADRLVSVRMRKGSKTLASVDPYGRDADGLVSSMAQKGLPGAASETYGYSSINQLTTRNATTQWAYDAADNLTRLTAGHQQFDAANQLCFTASTTGGSCASPPAGATTYGYDVRGNRTSRTTSAGVTTRYGYDQADRLTSVAAPAVPGTAGEYSPLTTAARMMDTRPATQTGNCGGACTTLPAGGGTRTLQVTGAGGIPSSGVDSVVVSLTAVPSTASGTVAAFAAGTTQPATASLNYQAGQTITNGAVVKVSAAGKISLYANSTVDLVVDVLGWYATSSGAIGSELTAVNPTRVLDTRSGSTQGTCELVPCARLQPGVALSVKVAGTSAAPSNATSAVTNVIGISPSTAGAITVYPTGQSRPATANLSFSSGQTIGATGLYKVGTSGYISVYSTAAVDVVFDVQGYGLPSASSNGASYVGAAPSSRLIDTRTPPTSCPATPCSALGTGGVATVQAVGGTSPVPAGASAIVVNMTAISSGGTGYLTAHSADQVSAPTASSLNFGSAAVSNAAVIKLSSDGKLKLAVGSITSGSVNYVIDIVGWYTTAWSHGHSPEGLRIGRVAPDGAKASFAWDHSTSLPLMLMETVGTATTSFLYGPDGLAVAQIASDNVTTTYLHHDQLGSTRLLTGATGSASGSVSYDPYGAITSSAGTLSRIGYAGEYTDAETGFQ
ncbi:MAG: hypothetical protein ACRDGJ_06565, partial [Candidatus Limnocylindria bacterium]